MQNANLKFDRFDLVEVAIRENPKFKIFTGRMRVDKFPFYLRLLDAEASGADIAMMASALSLHEAKSLGRKNMRDGLGAAHNLRDRDYRLIP